MELPHRIFLSDCLFTMFWESSLPISRVANYMNYCFSNIFRYTSVADWSELHSSERWSSWTRILPTDCSHYSLTVCRICQPKCLDFDLLAPNNDPSSKSKPPSMRLNVTEATHWRTRAVFSPVMHTLSAQQYGASPPPLCLLQQLLIALC